MFCGRAVVYFFISLDESLVSYPEKKDNRIVELVVYFKTCLFEASLAIYHEFVDKDVN